MATTNYKERIKPKSLNEVTKTSSILAANKIKKTQISTVKSEINKVISTMGDIQVISKSLRTRTLVIAWQPDTLD